MKKKAKEITVVNPKGLLTRREVAMVLGCSRMYVGLIVKDGLLVPSMSSYLGTKELFTIKDVEKFRKEHPCKNWKEKKVPVLAKSKK